MARDSEVVAAKAWRQTTYVVAATELFVLTGFGLALPFLPLYIQQLGFGTGPLLGAAVVAAAGVPALFVAAGLLTAAVAPATLLGRRWFPVK